MNRVLKFRAWYKARDELFPVTTLEFDRDGKLTGCSLHPGLEWGRVFDLAEVELMQFTGLLDGNGREIYEGDIVRITSAWNEHIAHVFWGKSRSLSSWDSGETWMLHFNGLPDEREGTLFPYCKEHHGDEIHIIGNIYENPELLEVQG